MFVIITTKRERDILSTENENVAMITPIFPLTTSELIFGKRDILNVVFRVNESFMKLKGYEKLTKVWIQPDENVIKTGKVNYEQKL